MSILTWHLDEIGDHSLRLEYDCARELWVASDDVEEDDDEGDEYSSFDLAELLATLTDQASDAPWITALVDQLEADRHARSRRGTIGW